MNRRSAIGTLMGASFTSFLAAGVTRPLRSEDLGWREARIEGLTFYWRHRENRLHARLIGRTRGWLAVGFNARHELAGTRFVMASVVDNRATAEVHIALVPEHRQVEALGGIADLQDVSGSAWEDETRIAFSLPHSTGDAYDVDLAPGSHVHLMLAWSVSPDFDHHSRIRKHRSLVL